MLYTIKKAMHCPNFWIILATCILEKKIVFFFKINESCVSKSVSVVYSPGSLRNNLTGLKFVFLHNTKDG